MKGEPKTLKKDELRGPTGTTKEEAKRQKEKKKKITKTFLKLV
jgi:hypothetical protein